MVQILTLYQVLSGLVAGIFQLVGSFQVIVGHPLDTLKVLKQVQVNQNIFNLVSKFCKQNGLTGLFHGILPYMIGNSIITALQFGIYQYILRKGIFHYSFFNSYFAGSTVGLIGGFILGPLEQLKIQMQIGHLKKMKFGTFKLMHYIYKHYGLKGVFRGTQLAMIREVVGLGIFFGFYQKIKLYISNQFKLDNTGIIIAGACAGSIYYLMSYSIDMIKTKIQSSKFDVKKKNMEVFRKYYQNGKLFSGIHIPLIRGLMTCAVEMYSYQYTLQKLKNAEFRFGINSQ